MRYKWVSTAALCLIIIDTAHTLGRSLRLSREVSLLTAHCTYFIIFEENVTSRFSIMRGRCDGSRNIVLRIQLDDNSILNCSKGWNEMT